MPLTVSVLDDPLTGTHTPELLLHGSASRLMLSCNAEPDPAVPVICAAALAVNVVVPPGETNVQPTCEGPSGGGH
ncbi:MAG: hypothetical protein IPM02_06520 [Betaproteobacteria bacterium]|nr:hypothetical protein [Betaproteobacteria bacterium]